jgi:phenylpyruvate tautomerase
MPYVKVQINREIPSTQSGPVLSLISKRIAKELGKPEQYVMAELTGNPAMIFAGTAEPAAYVELKSIGLPSAVLSQLSKSFSGLLHEHFGVEPGRVYIEFIDIKGSHWGWNGGTF